MGSILAETREVRRIEELVAPLKDVFGAVFFVSVGMLLNPTILLENLAPIALICLVIVVGKVASVTFGALMTGQTLSTAIHSGLSMAQIGEFSFIIATLGFTYKVIDDKLYPFIVAASLITTFTTPYFLKLAPYVATMVDRRLSPGVKGLLERYSQWFRGRSVEQSVRRAFYQRLGRWGANAILVITIFVLSAEKLVPWLDHVFGKSSPSMLQLGSRRSLSRLPLSGLC